jgi:CheY-like chemotaxis protein
MELDARGSAVANGRVVQRVAQSMPSILRRRSAVVRPDLRGLRVLMVESDEGLLMVFALHLESCGAHVQPASSFAEARMALRTAEWHLMFTELDLPDGTGLELAQLAASYERPPACVALAARCAQSDLDEARRASFRMHVRKPCDLETLALIALQFRQLELG